MTRGTDVTDFKLPYRTPKPEEFPETICLTLQKETTGKNALRYGENPHQAGAIYRIEGSPLPALTNIRLAKESKKVMSATNYMDVTHAIAVLKFFSEPAVVVMKHTKPSGFAVQRSGEPLQAIYRKARDVDARSAYGCFAVFNREVDEATAAEVLTTFVEGVAAPAYTPQALALLDAKEKLRAVLFDNIERLPKWREERVEGQYDFKSMPTGRVLVQDPYLSRVRATSGIVIDPFVITKDGRKILIARDPTPQELSDLVAAWHVTIDVPSNAICIYNNGEVLVGTGQQERVGALEQALVKGFQKAMDREGIAYDPLEGAKERLLLKHNPFKGAVLASDGFIPFRDSVDLLGRCGFTAVIQPGGSERDAEVIQAANAHNMAMVFTGERCFNH